MVSTPLQSRSNSPLSPDLQTCCVLVHSLTELQQLIEELRRERHAFQTILEAQIGAVKALGDLYLELTEETEKRKFLAKAILKAERLAKVQRLPAWLFRLPDSGTDPVSELRRRAAFIMGPEHQANPDDCFDILREILSGWPGEDFSDEDLTRIIKEAGYADS